MSIADDRTVVGSGSIVYHKVSGERMLVDYCGLDPSTLHEVPVAKVTRCLKDFDGNNRYESGDLFPLHHLETYEARHLRDLESLKYLNAVMQAEGQIIN